jgi:chromosomal replication initiator protein
MNYVEPVTLRQMHMAWVEAHDRLTKSARPRAPVPAKPAERVRLKPAEPVPAVAIDGVRPLGEDQHAAISGAIDEAGRQLALAKAALDEIRPEQKRRPQIMDIKRATARHYGVPLIEMESSRRHHIVVRPRQVAMYLAKTMTPRSLPEIGRRFGGKDHTTVIHAVRKIDALVKKDQELADTIAAIREELGEERRPPSEGS